MEPDPAGGIESIEEYRRTLEHVARRVSGDPGLAAQLRQLLAFEARGAVPDGDTLAARLRVPSVPRGRTAIISDIHGNLPGLEAALRDIEAQRCDRIVCLGDLVDGGPDNEPVVERLRGLGIACVRGNHDEYNDLRLADHVRAFLAALPEQLVEGDLLYTHISPRAIRRKINHAVEAWNVFEESGYRMVFVGHVHVPLIFGKRSAAYGEATPHAFDYNAPFELADGDRYIVCVGSLGYGRDRVGRLRYGIHDRDAGCIELRSIDGPLLPFDHALAAGGAA